MSIKPLKPDELRWNCTPSFLQFYKDPKTFKGAKGIVGQERALTALQLGLDIRHSGYNIYVAGMAGSGRMTTIRRTLEELNPICGFVPDRCYVYNFAEPSEPLLLTFSRGKGRLFRDDMKDLVKVLRSDIPKTFESSHVIREREGIVERYQVQEKKLFEGFAEQLKKEGFALIQIQEGNYVAPTIFPVINEEAVSIDHLESLVKEGKLSNEERSRLFVRHRELTAELKQVLTKARALGKQMHEALERLQQRWGSLLLDGVMDELRKKYTDDDVRKHLIRVKKHILTNIDAFIGGRDNPQQMHSAGGMMLIGPQKQEDPFWYYEVNLLTGEEGEGKEATCPILEEDNPSYMNLFGAVEYDLIPGGAWSTDFRHIRAGSLLKADGGYLIINALDVLRRPHVWDQLKRVLKSGKLTIQQPESSFQITPMAIKPQPIELNVKIIMIGPDWLYRLLWNHEEDFSKMFKMLADFDTSMPLTKQNAKLFASVLKSVCERGKLKSLSTDGLASMLEYSVEASGQRDRISTLFTYASDIVREADHVAQKKEATKISREHVMEAIKARDHRHHMAEERVQRLIEDGTLLITTKGKRIGQVNGLAVYSLGHTSFGKPSRITAVTSVGKAGIINIEREANLSGPTHDKGVLILTGYLRHQYAQKHPLNLSASLAFEQSYGGVDGDSASSTEVYALLSSLSGLPIDQGLAVTGSVNQHGDVQPIGGVNEKIEGFFDVCKTKGLTGKQGVLIPIQNKRHLMLRHDVVEAVKQKKFHISAVSTIDEGIELLTGTSAGKRNRKGEYPPKSVHGRVMKRLQEMGEAVEKNGKEKENAYGRKKTHRKSTRRT